MSKSKKHEYEASDLIHHIEREIVRWFKASGHSYPSIHVNPEFYYADDGRPSRYLTLHFGKGSEIRVSVERQLGKKSAWICYWAVFMAGKNHDEGQFDAVNSSQIVPELTKKIIARYEYAFD